MLILALIVAFVFRFYRLGQFPPGLYRDEAINGLDALKVLQGEHAFFFAANNGREPLYVYLTAAAISLFGQTAFALRLAAAVIGTVATLPVYLLGKSWLGWRVGVLAAWIWAITLWPVHLSRIGFRVILLAPVLALSFWLGTLAYRRGHRSLWTLSGLVYGLTFYTYLAARFTPLFLLLLLLFLVFSGRKRKLWPGAAWFVCGTLLALLPLLILGAQQPDLFIGRSGQVSLLHPDVNGGNLWGTLWRHLGAALGMFVYRGDSILRHNPAGRPVFDLLMLVPFLLGLLWCARHWRRPAAMVLLLWIVVMLGPTILAADAPHFLRAAGILPAIIFLPAIGLERIWLWNRLPPLIRSLPVAGLLLGSLLLTIRDYAVYAGDPLVAHAFESVAADLARQINEEDAATSIFVDERLWSNWPSLDFLAAGHENMQLFTAPSDLPQQLPAPVTLYVWPYESLDTIPEVLALPALISASGSELVYGELDDSSYQLFVRFGAAELPLTPAVPAAEFENGLILQQVDVLELADDRLQVDVYWQSDYELEEELIVFVHVVGDDGLLGQHDAPPAEGQWPAAWWGPGQTILDRHVVSLAEPYDASQHQVQIGLYRASTGERLLIMDDANGKPSGTAWTVGSE